MNKYVNPDTVVLGSAVIAVIGGVVIATTESPRQRSTIKGSNP